MEYIVVLLIALAMSIDAFSVALGVGCRGHNIRIGIKLAAAFGIFQFIMPLLGAFMGQQLGKYFSGMSYVSAAILFFIAYKMFMDMRKTETERADDYDPTQGFGIVMLGLATSLDAFGVGIPISMMDMDTVMIAIIIGVVCAVITTIGFYLGKVLVKYVKKAGYVGSFTLFAIGIKALLS